MSNVRFDELELMLMAMFEQKTLKAYDSDADGSSAACGRGCRDGCACSAEHPEAAAAERAAVQRGWNWSGIKPVEPNQKVERVADE